MKLSIKETTPFPINKASYTFGAIEEDARIRVEQDADLEFKLIKRKLICEEYDEHLLQTDPKTRHLLVHENRLIVKDGILTRNYYREWGQVTHQLIPIPEHLITELLKAIHGQMGKHDSQTHENDPKMQIKIILLWMSKINQTMGTEMWRLH